MTTGPNRIRYQIGWGVPSASPSSDPCRPQWVSAFADWDSVSPLLYYVGMKCEGQRTQHSEMLRDLPRSHKE